MVTQPVCLILNCTDLKKSWRLLRYVLRLPLGYIMRIDHLPYLSLFCFVHSLRVNSSLSGLFTSM